MRESTAKPKKWRGTKAIISIIVVGALLMPTIPLSEVVPAFADDSSQASPTGIPAIDQAGKTTSELGAVSDLADDLLARGTTSQVCASEIMAVHPNQIYAELPLDGSVVDDQGIITPGYATDAALLSISSSDDASNSSSSEASDFEKSCANCLSTYDTLMEAEEQRVAETEQQAQQAVEASGYLTQDFVEEAQLNAAEQEEATSPVVQGLTFDTQSMSAEEATAAAIPAATSATTSATSVTDYSAEVVLKDITSITLYSGSYVANGFRDTHLNSNSKYYSLYVQCYRIPAFYAPVKSARVENGKAYLTFTMPKESADEPRDIEILFSTNISDTGYVNAPGGRAQVNDATVLSALSQIPGYDAARNHAYLNAYKLAPFASYEDIVKSGNAMPASSRLATKDIQELWPIHEKKGMKVSLLKGEETGIVRFQVYFADGVSEVYDLDYLGIDSLAASYVTKDTGVLYQPDFWVIGDNGKKGVDRVASFICARTYNDYFAPFKSDVKMHRTVRDYFDHTMHDNAEEVAANLLTNIDGWCATYTDAQAWISTINIAENAQPTDDWTSTAIELKMFNLLFLYTYWERFLDIDMGGNAQVGARKDANLFLIMAFRGSVINNNCSLAKMTYSVRSGNMLSYSMVRLLSTTVIHNQLAPFTGYGDAPSLVRAVVGRTTGYTDICDWFRDYMSTIAFYHEYKPKVLEGFPETDELIWRGWDQASRRYADSILLWLTMEPGAMYMASSSLLLSVGSTYTYHQHPSMDDQSCHAFYKDRLDAKFVCCQQYSSTVATIVGKERVNNTDILVLDNMMSYYDNGRLENIYYESHGLWGKHYTEDPYHKNFFDVSELYDTTGGQGASAATYNVSPTNKRIMFFAYRALDCGWYYEWSHELAHAIDNDVFMGNTDRREGCTNEDYTDGLLTQGHSTNSPIMNLSYYYGSGNDRMANFTPDRLYGKDAADDFYKKTYEALDVLDYAALKAFLRLDKDQQNAVASQVWFKGQDGTSPLDSGTNTTVLCSRKKVLAGYDGTTTTMPVNASVFNDGSKKFETVEEVYDNQIFLRPGIPDGGSITWTRAIYVSEDNIGTWWFPVHCNDWYPDSRSFKVMMYRMFGREGYDAFSTYGSGGGNDLQKLQQITGCSSYKEWQMRTWNGIEAKKDSLGYVDFDSLVDKFEVALKSDADHGNRNLSDSFSLRSRMFFMMKRVTNDFRYGLYDDHTPVTHISTLEDLLAIAENPQGNYVLDADIDASGVEFDASKALVDSVFYGKFDGQNHTIYAQGHPLPYLFKGMRDAYVKDVALGGVVRDIVSPTIANCEIENVSYTRFERDIHTVQDFLNINEDLRLGVKTFHLKADLDFTEWSRTNAAAETKQTMIVAQPMIGTSDSPKVFDGGGHVISGVTGASLFGHMCFTEMSGLTIRNSENRSADPSKNRMGLLSNISYKCTFTDLFFDNVRLSGRAQVGFVSGDDGLTNASGQVTRDGGSQFKRIQVTNATLEVGANFSETDKISWGGFITGILATSSMEDIYVQGTLTTYGTKCGGVVGEITKSATLNRCISNVNMDCRNTPDNGVVVGTISDDDLNVETTSLSNCIGIGPTDNGEDANLMHDKNPLSCNRLAYTEGDVGAVFSDCYESANRKFGLSMVGDAALGVGFVRTTYMPRCVDNGGTAVKNYLYRVPNLRNNVQFFTDHGFNRDTWEFEPTIEVGYPMLRFVGDRDTFYDYDINIELDFENEELRLSGSSLAGSAFYRSYVHGLPFKSPVDGYDGHKKGEWIDREPTDPADMLNVMFSSSGVCDLSEVIEYEGFKGEEVAQKGTRSVTIEQQTKVSGKPYSFEKTIEIPPRPEMDCADRVHGVRADSEGMGSIHFASIGIYHPTDLEYRKVAATGEQTKSAEGNVSNAAAQTDGAWTTLPSAITPAEPGTYEVRIAATDHSFASYPTTIVVDEYDPNAVIFPLILEPNGGIWNSDYAVPNSYSSEEGLTLPDASVLVRDGYTFKGWYTSPDFAGEQVANIPVGEQDSVTLYARWEAKSYGVTLHYNGGAPADSASDVTSYTAGVGAQLPQATRPHRAFAGWFDNEACEGKPVEAISAMDFGDKTFWAKWLAVNHTVALHLHGGALPEGVSDTFAYEEGTAANLPVPVLAGYTFKGWYRDKECTGQPLFAIAENASVGQDLWAKWAADVYDVTLVYNGGKLFVGEMDVVSYQYGSEVELPQMERNGYEFAGWYDNADLGGSPVTAIAQGEMGAKSFWAKWTPLTYTISYDLGEAAFAELGDMIDPSFESYTTGEGKVLPGAAEMVWTDHVFAGWYESADFSGSPLTKVSPESYGNLTLYARWTGNACVLSYHTDSGAFAMSPQTVFPLTGSGAYREGDEVALPGADGLSRRGYVFEGWYADENRETGPLESVALAKGVINLYAKWSLEQYRISYELNGGTFIDGATPPADYTVETELVALPSSDVLTREGFTFKGWFEDAACEGMPVSAIQKGETGDRTFYALWEQDVVGPPEPPAPAPTITSLTFAGSVVPQVKWDETGYGRIELARSKMPVTADDLRIEVPDGIEVVSVTKRARSFIHPLVAFFFAARQESESVFWDILLRQKAEPHQEKLYTLEIVPLDEGDDGGQGSSSSSSSSSSGSSSSGGTTVPPRPGQPSSSSSSASSQASSSSSSSSDEKAKLPVAVGGDDDTTNTNGGDGTPLPDTGDDMPLLMALVIAMGMVSLVLAIAARRRSRS